MDKKIRRIVTGHTLEGKSIFTSDDFFDTKVISSGDAKMTTIWTTEAVPADCNDHLIKSLKTQVRL